MGFGTNIALLNTTVSNSIVITSRDISPFMIDSKGDFGAVTEIGRWSLSIYVSLFHGQRVSWCQRTMTIFFSGGGASAVLRVKMPLSHLRPERSLFIILALKVSEDVMGET